MQPVTVKFSHWLPKLLKVGGITLGHTIYLTYPKSQGAGMRALFKHECVHVQQVEAFKGLIPFLFMYVCEWVRAGFSYGKNSLEVAAYAVQNQPYTLEEEREWNRWFR